MTVATIARRAESLVRAALSDGTIKAQTAESRYPLSVVTYEAAQDALTVEADSAGVTLSPLVLKDVAAQVARNARA